MAEFSWDNIDETIRDFQRQANVLKTKMIQVVDRAVAVGRATTVINTNYRTGRAQDSTKTSINNSEPDIPPEGNYPARSFTEVRAETRAELKAAGPNDERGFATNLEYVRFINDGTSRISPKMFYQLGEAAMQTELDTGIQALQGIDLETAKETE